MKKSKEVCIGKITYTKLKTAQERAKQQTKKYKEEMKVYKCKHSGWQPHYHLARVK